MPPLPRYPEARKAGVFTGLSALFPTREPLLNNRNWTRTSRSVPPTNDAPSEIEFGAEKENRGWASNEYTRTEPERGVNGGCTELWALHCGPPQVSPP
jgi:hypothetical protein